MNKYHKPKLTRVDLDVVDFMMGVDHMSNEEIGQYMRLICHALLNNQECSIPADAFKLSRIARCVGLQDSSNAVALQQHVSPLVLEKFTPREDGRLVNERLLKEFRAAQERQNRAKDKADKRWENERRKKDATALQGQCQTDAEVMPISDSISISTSIKGERESTPKKQYTFDDFDKEVTPHG